MAISDSINGIISKGFDVAGTASVVKDVLPPSIRDPLNKIFGFGQTAPTGRKRVSSLSAVLNKFGGVQRNSHFYVTLPVPNKLKGNTGSNDLTINELSLLCEAAALPGVSLATSEIKRYGYGVFEKKPHSVIFTDQTLTFMGDNSGKIHRFFYIWMNSILKFDTKHTQLGENKYGIGEPFSVEYKKQDNGLPNYCVDIKITCINEAELKIQELTLMDAYPIFLGDVQLSWAETDSFVRFPVTFTYTNWKLEDIDVSTVLKGGREPSLVEKIVKAGTAIQTLASLRKPQGVGDIINVVNNSKIAAGGILGLF